MEKDNLVGISRERGTGQLSRRDVLSGIGATVAGAAFLPATTVQALMQQTPGPQGIQLFNGTDLSGFYTYLTEHGRNNDPNGVFGVDDGMLHITGQDNGAIVSEADYENYRLVVEYKFGERMWPPREGQALDNGLLVHCGKEAGVNFGQFPRAIQFQIYQGAVGDMVLLPGNEHLSVMVEGEERPGGFQHVPGASEESRMAGGSVPFNITTHFEKDPEWQNVTGFHSPNDATNPHGEWNTMEVIAEADTLTCSINGKVVNKATNLRISGDGTTESPHTKGAIGFQSEGGEIYFRRVELLPLG